MAKLKSRQGLRRHNQQGHYYAEKKFKQEYGRSPDKNERRDNHSMWTGGHTEAIYTPGEETMPKDPLQVLLDSDVGARRFYTGRTGMTNRQAANNFFDDAERVLKIDSGFDKKRVDFSVLRGQLFQTLVFCKETEAGYEEVEVFAPVGRYRLN